MQNFENNTNISDRFALLGVASEWMISELANTMITVPYWVSSFCKKKKKKDNHANIEKTAIGPVILKSFLTHVMFFHLKSILYELNIENLIYHFVCMCIMTHKKIGDQPVDVELCSDSSKSNKIFPYKLLAC